MPILILTAVAWVVWVVPIVLAVAARGSIALKLGAAAFAVTYPLFTRVDKELGFSIRPTLVGILLAYYTFLLIRKDPNCDAVFSAAVFAAMSFLWVLLTYRSS